LSSVPLGTIQLPRGNGFADFGGANKVYYGECGDGEFGVLNNRALSVKGRCTGAIFPCY